MFPFKAFTYTFIGVTTIIQSNFSPASAESLRGRQQRSLTDTDLHGCQASTGYSYYCESTATCIRPWVTECPISDGQGFSGVVTMECTNGQCSGLTSACSLYDINNESALNSPTLFDLTGDYYLPSGCSITCNNCEIKNFPSPKTDGHGCMASAGYSYCPETKECIRFNENCPIQRGTVMNGSKALTCSAGARMSNLTSECNLTMTQSDGTTITLAGPSISNMEGQYLLPEGCSATVIGCTTKNLMGSF